ncbi:MAG: UDP-N-acetylmuramoyl-L-alanyl-D-glutamate--2,6-diaminopimelate ligase [Legionellales bacterium]|nr:UDP-N-acetylmuramoyl-L-alanyl-D-glutamate--2,6-diaminopimelate ligase [Legionellales bacterium]
MLNQYPYHVMLSDLLRALVECDLSHDVAIVGITADSRKIKPGYAFVAYPGHQCDGRDFIESAVRSGASAILMESPTGKDGSQLRSFSLTNSEKKTIPVVYVLNLQNLYGVFVSRFYKDPSRQLTVVGITGTNGKSSIMHLYNCALNGLGIKSGFIGTLGSGIAGKLVEQDHTTPDAAMLHQQLAKMRDSHVEQVVMEVSSHGLDQSRVNGCIFDTAILSNVTRDHLDYHATQEEYLEAKAKLFAKPFLRNIVVNIDDQFGKELFIRYSSERNVIGYSLDKKYLGHRSVVVAHQIKSDLDGSTFEIRSPWGVGQMKTQLIGRFNVYNLLAAFTSMCLHDTHFEDALESLSLVHSIPGRMNRFGGDGVPKVFVDYAHTSDALVKVMSSIKQHSKEGKLIVLFGCGGDRDRGKRMLMGQAASKYADFIVLTDDNPRFENPDRIIDDILTGIDNQDNVDVEHDRSIAIAKAFKLATPDDIVLIAGKGHESFQHIAGQKYPFSDSEQVQMLIRANTQQVV